MDSTRRPLCFLRSIQLVNFMCHDNLLVEFSKKVTCIVGDNGSGKSAIMVALGVLFGVRATAMRGSSYKQYVKTGEEYAVIRAVLSQEGNNGELRCLAIEKRISAESSKIKITEDDIVVGRTQDDLNSLIEQLRINLKNPVCFLTQDKSKKILKEHNLKSIYAFFKSATDIENIEDIHVKDSGLIDSIKSSLEEVAARKANKTNMLEAVLKRLEIKKAILTTEEAIKRLKIEKAWARVRDQEKKRSDTEREREEILNKFSEYSQEKSRVLIEIESVSARIAEITERRKGLLVKRQSQQERFKEVIAQNERKYAEITRELEQYTYEIEQKTRKIKRIEQVIGKPRSATEDENTEMQETLAKLKSKAEEECISAEKNQTKLEVQKAQIEITIKKHQSEMQSLEIAKVKKKDILHSYRSNSPIKFYGHPMERALAEIKEKKLEVSGPIGLSIQVKDTKWSRAIEVALGNTVFGFIVHTRETKETLEEILTRNRVHKYRIYLTKQQSERANDRILQKAKEISNRILNEAYIISKSPITTVLSQIEDNDILVVEQLIILQGIEKIGLIDSRYEGYTLLQRKVPFDYILTPSPDKIQYVGTSLSDMRCTVREKQLLVSKEGEILLIKEIEKLKQKIEEAQERVNRLQSESDTIYSRLRTNNELIEQAKSNIFKIEKRIKEKDEIMKDDLEIEYRECKESLESIIQQRESVRETQIEVQRLLQTSQNRLSETLKANKHTQDEEDTTYRKSIKEYTQEDTLIKEKMEKIKLEMATLQTTIHTMDKYLENLHKECLLTKDSALNLSHQEIVMVSKTKEEIDKEIIDLEARTLAYTSNSALCIDLPNNSDSSLLTDQAEDTQLENKKTELQHEISRIDTILRENLEEIEEIEKGTAERIRKREELKYKLAEGGSISFTHLMNMREYSGSLEFDHTKEELGIRVKVCSESKGNKNTLSGGERSFSGICFLLSLWPLINSPLRILDEFDVFMDGLNRKASFNLIFETARTINTQIIIITPLGVPSPPPDICEVFTLKPPIR